MDRARALISVWSQEAVLQDFKAFHLADKHLVFALSADIHLSPIHTQAAAKSSRVRSHTSFYISNRACYRLRTVNGEPVAVMKKHWANPTESGVRVSGISVSLPPPPGETHLRETATEAAESRPWVHAIWPVLPGLRVGLAPEALRWSGGDVCGIGAWDGHGTEVSRVSTDELREK